MLAYIFDSFVTFGFWIISSPLNILVHEIISMLLFYWLIKYRNKVNKYVYSLVTVFFIILFSCYFAQIIYYLVKENYVFVYESMQWPPSDFSQWALYGALFLTYVLFLFVFIVNMKTLFTTKKNKFFAIRYIGQIILFFLLLTPAAVYLTLNSPRDLTIGDGVTLTCLTEGESIGCKTYYWNGIGDAVVQWCEGVHQVGESKDGNGKSIYENWEQNKGYWEEISKKALSELDDEYAVNTTLTINAVNKTVVMGTVDAIYPCINPSKGGYIYIIDSKDV
jgi:uncharacterized membrane protein